MAKIYFFKATMLDDLADKGTAQYAGVIAADSYGDAAEIIVRQNTTLAGECELVCIDYLEEVDSTLCTYDLDLYAQMYKEML